MLLSIRKSVAEAGGQLIVLLIPTKELVFADKVLSLGQSSALYKLLVTMETENRNEIIELCQIYGIAVSDPLPLLRESVEHDEPIYLESLDGHPTAKGYARIADAVYATLLSAKRNNE
jgi:hypothetical protein